jgi:hypothetical protein
MRNDALILLIDQREPAIDDLEACEMMMVECREDPDACNALGIIQAKYEALADELDTQIQKLR